MSTSVFRNIHPLMTLLYLSLPALSVSALKADDLSLGGFGTPTINGALGSGEWDTAGSTSFQAALPGGGTANATLFVMNDALNLYIAVRVQASFSSGGFSIEFDNDHDGVGPENGDDALVANRGGTVTDGVRTESSPGCSGSGPGTCGPSDTDVGGTNDVTGADSDNGTFIFFEVSHPLDSNDDANDFSLKAGDSVGFTFSLIVCDSQTCGQTDVPAGGGYGDIQIVSGSEQPQQPVRLYFAHIGNGGGFTSDIVLANPVPDTTLSGTVYFYADDGSPLQIGLQTTQDGVVGPLAGSSHVAYSIQPLGQLTLTTDGAGTLAIGSVRVTSDGPVGGVIRFRVPNIGIAGVGDSLRFGEFVVPVRRSKDGINTGLAIHNCNDEPITLEMLLRNESGHEVAGGYKLVDAFPAAGHMAQFINELFPEADTDGFVGVLEVHAFGGGVAATALELGSQAGEFTTLPVIPFGGIE